MKIQLANWFAGFDELGREIPATTPAQFIVAMRDVRDVMLRESDWTQVVDVALPDEKKQEWVVFRQMLRDLTNQFDETNIGEIIEIVDPPLGAPKTWRVLTPEYHIERQAQVEAIERAIAESNHASEDHTGADHTH